MVRQAHHPEQRRRANSKFEISMTETGYIGNSTTNPLFGIYSFGHWILFVISDLLFGFSHIMN
jgi:hypothetical protein